MSGQEARGKEQVDKAVTVFSAPFHYGQKRAGVDRGALELLRNGLVDELRMNHVECKPVDPRVTEPSHGHWLIHQPGAVAEAARNLYNAVFESASGLDVRWPLVVLGGDHSIALGSVPAVCDALAQSEAPPLGLAVAQPVVIWFDAHADINTLKTTLSGNIHGCPVSFLMNHPDSRELPEFEWFFERLEAYASRTGNPGFVVPGRLAYIGLRDVEDSEMRILRDCGFMPDAWSMERIEGVGRDIEAMMRHILQSIDPDGNRPIHLSFDVDGMDPSVTPSTGTPVPGGLTLAESMRVVRCLKQTGRLLSVDIVEVNPLLGTPDDVKKTIANTISLIKAAVL